MDKRIRITFEKKGYTDLKWLCRSRNFIFGMDMIKSDIDNPEAFKWILEHLKWQWINVYTAKRNGRVHLVGWGRGDVQFSLYILTKNEFDYADKKLYAKSPIRKNAIKIVTDGYDPPLNCWHQVAHVTIS